MSNVDSPSLQNRGIEWYLSDHEGFIGRYKETCEDFHVTEVDKYGNPVSMETNFQRHPAEDCSEKNLMKSTDGKDKNAPKSANDAGTNQQQVEHEWQRPKRDHVLASLMKCIDQETYLVLEKFSGHYRSNHGNTCDRHHSNPGWDGDHLSLGIFETKEVRCTIHRCVKQLHPHLKTSTRQQLNQIGSEIFVTPDPIHREFASFLEGEDVDNLMTFVDAKEHNTFVQLKVGESKPQRTAIHRLIAKQFGSIVESKTFIANFKGNQTNEETTISVRFRQKFHNRGKKRKVADVKQEDVPVYTGFTMKKKDIETLDAIQQIAKATGSQASNISYAGTKDKKAVTMQAMVIKDVIPSRLQQINEKLTNISIGNIHPCSQPLQLGKLGGNHFDIILRDIKQHGKSSSNDDQLRDLISSAVKNVQERGFINYFGQQRFGTAETPVTADRVGLAIMKGNMRDAVDLILKPGKGNDPVNTAKRHWQMTHNAKETLQLMPRYKSRECMILKALHRHGQDDDGFTKALMAIPHAMRLLYIHSYCSLVWNHMASYRIQNGCQPIQGDLVEVAEESQTKVHEVTEEDITARRYSIEDVVLPLPGNSVTMPTNFMRERYSQYLESDGVTAECFRISSLKLNIPGDYRKLLARPKHLTWSFVSDISKNGGTDGSLQRVERCEDSREPDVQKNAVSFANSSCERSKSSEPKGACQSELSGEEKLNTNAIKISFDLQPSSYATMCLREILKKQLD
ncbi:pseudouridylate synthase PUS7L-like [Ptychodera flava]|uniref:pseudouridylate synthase PUS7L-like n=1 Tax=Ptychodera flava TaxID=63121 RepID=UPI003969E1E8